MVQMGYNNGDRLLHQDVEKRQAVRTARHANHNRPAYWSDPCTDLQCNLLEHMLRIIAEYHL